MNCLLFCLQQFLQQYRHYQSNVQIFKLQPDKPNKDLADLVMFLAQVLTALRLLSTSKPVYVRATNVLYILTLYTLCGYSSPCLSGWSLLPAAPVHLSTRAD